MGDDPAFGQFRKAHVLILPVKTKLVRAGASSALALFLKRRIKHIQYSFFFMMLARAVRSSSIVVPR